MNDLAWLPVFRETSSIGRCGVFRHRNVSRGAVFELLVANVRRAMRGVAVFSRDLARLAVSLHEEDMIVGSTVRCSLGVGSSDVV